MEVTDRLASWKEISSHLGVDVRTCQRWEKSLGLPVKRIDGSAKSRVFASRAEVDAWMANLSARNGSAKDGGLPPEEFSQYVRDRRRRRNLIHAGLAVAAVLSVAAALITFRPRDLVPADFRIDGPFLVITNKAGHELWRKDTGLPDLMTEKEYRWSFQKRRVIRDNNTVAHPRLIIADLDGDGRNEILFAIINDSSTSTGKMVLYDDAGRERWPFDTGTDIVVGNRHYAPDFLVDGFEVADADADGRKEIIVVSHVRVESPTRILVLGLDKTIKGEYWNYGQISDFILLDIDRDGRPELLCAGQNNGYDRPCVFLLDPSRLSGASPQDERSRFEGKGPGSELYYVLLPVTALGALKGPGQAAFSLDPGPSGDFSAYTQLEFLKFDFGPDMKLLAPVVSHSFQRAYAEALAAGAKLPALDVDKVAAELAANIRYYDGAMKAWVNRWARSNPR
jgi:hypothetical protein